MSKPKWILTDSDAKQYGRQFTDILFEFKETGKDATGIDVICKRKRCSP